MAIAIAFALSQKDPPYYKYKLQSSKPVVTGKKIVSFLSIFGSQFLSRQKVSVATEDTAELDVKHV